MLTDISSARESMPNGISSAMIVLLIGRSFEMAQQAGGRKEG